MTTAATWRALAPTEKIYADKEMYSGYTSRVSGRLDTDALATAFDAVCRAHPQLACRLEPRGDAVAVVAADVPPVFRVVDGDPDRPLTGVEFAPSRVVTALNVVRDGSEASVTLLIHHSIADGGHIIGVIRTLWSCYTDVVHGVPLDLPRQPFPKSLEDILAERGVYPPDRSATDTGTPESVAVTDESARERFELIRPLVQHRLTTAQTSALTELGHREGLTMHSLLSGAVLLVESEVRELPLEDMLFRFTVDLRNRLTPRVGATEVTNPLGGGTFRPTAELKPDAVPVGRAIGERLRAGLDDGSLQRSLLDIVYGHVPPLPTANPPSAVVSLTNPGVIPRMPTPDDLRLTNFHSTTRIKVPREEFRANGGYIVSTLDGRLSIELAWAEGDPGLPRRLDRIQDQIDRLTRRV